MPEKRQLQREEKRRKKLGKPMSEADLAALADVTPEDVAAALDLWTAHAPPGWEGLLDAAPDYQPAPRDPDGDGQG